MRRWWRTGKILIMDGLPGGGAAAANNSSDFVSASERLGQWEQISLRAILIATAGPQALQVSPAETSPTGTIPFNLSTG